jgi:hypothetical protein
MAYLDLELAIGGGCAVAPPAPVRLDDLERQAVLVSRNDDLRSLRSSGRGDRVKALVFGARPARRLADDRLEAIRRYALLYRINNGELARAEVAAAQAAGLSAAKLAIIRLMVDRWRAPAAGRRPTAYAAPAILLLATALPLQAWLSEETGDGLIALILVLVALITAVALLSTKGSRR